MDYLKLADLLFDGELSSVGELEERYPPRKLPAGACVTRFAPSPTGFVHMGSLLPSLVSERLAAQSGGVFFLRIEDTDRKREVADGVRAIIEALDSCGIRFHEGACENGESGDYGPYSQRRREKIYHAFAKKLVAEGHAYPCFCSEEALEAMRAGQQAEKADFGYHGRWARCRELSFEDIEARLKAGEPYVLRLRCTDTGGKVVLNDLVKGRIEMPQNAIDHVLLKSDGIPTYHLAHAVDDHLMRVTHVVRGDEWLATYPLHHQLFDLFGFKRPEYIHLSPLMKMDGSSKRKLSKRKDPESALSYYTESGYTPEALIEYIFTLLNSNYEDWRRENPEKPSRDFGFSTSKMSASGALFDLAKLDDLSRNALSRMSAEEIYKPLTLWTACYDTELHGLLTRNAGYTISILSIGRGGAKPRKDFARWNELRSYLGFFFDELFTAPELNDAQHKICRAYREEYDPDCKDQSEWFSGVKTLSERLGYCPDMKSYRKDPSAWKGNVADVSMALRLALTGRENSPDLYEVMRILGSERVLRRLSV